MTHQDKLADHLDKMMESGKTSSKNPLVNTALRLSNAPEVQLPDATKAQLLEKVLASSPTAAPAAQSGFLSSSVLAALAIGVTIMAIAAAIMMNNNDNGSDLPPNSAPTATSVSTEELHPTLTQAVTPEPSQTATEEATEEAKATKDFGCERPGNYCNSQGTPGGVERGNR